MNIPEARALMHEWVQNPSLRTHMESVAACMAAYCPRLAAGADATEIERWTVCGLLHDFDWERYPTAEEHPIVGSRHLESVGIDAGIREAILGHCAERTGVAHVTPMAKALFACDELAGFIVACGKVRPDGLAALEPRSVVKKLKTPSFAAAVSRADIAQGMAELREALGGSMSDEEHIGTCIAAIRGWGGGGA